MHELDDRPASRDYVRDRLRSNRPDLYARVEAGEVALSAAAVEAGVRPRMRSTNITSPATAITGLCRVFALDDLRAAMDEIENGRTASVEAAVAQALKA